MPGVRTGKANMKVVTGFTIKQLEWEKYRSLQYTSSALMSSIGIKYGQFAQVLARIKAAFEADGFTPPGVQEHHRERETRRAQRNDADCGGQTQRQDAVRQDI